VRVKLIAMTAPAPSISYSLGGRSATASAPVTPPAPAGLDHERLVEPCRTALAEHARSILPQPVANGTTEPFVIENRPGAGGVTGALAVARAAADGYRY